MKPLIDQLYLILICGGIVLGCFMVLVLNSRTVRKSRANIFLSVLLISLSFSIVHILYAGKLINHFSIHVHPVGDPTFLLIAPLLWFYIIELTGSRVKFSLAEALHFIPFIFVISCSLLFRFIPRDSPFIQFLGTHQRASITFCWIITVTQFSWYQYFIHKKWKAYRQLMEQEVSNTENISIAWVKFFVGVFLCINIFFLIALFVVIHIQSLSWIWQATGVLFSLSIFALGYKGVLQKEIFYIVASHDRIPAETTAIKTIHRKPDQSLVKKLFVYMEDKKPYLNPEMTLSSLAEGMKISRSQLSYIINEETGDNFYNFINKYRVEQVKKFMQDPAMKNFNMLGMALEAGFKSKSTFNLIFKRFTGLTPSQYRKNSMN